MELLDSHCREDNLGMHQGFNAGNNKTSDVETLKLASGISY